MYTYLTIDNAELRLHLFIMNFHMGHKEYQGAICFDIDCSKPFTPFKVYIGTFTSMASAYIARGCKNL